MHFDVRFSLIADKERNVSVRLVPEANVSNICEHLSVESKSHCIRIQMRRNLQGQFSGLWLEKGA